MKKLKRVICLMSTVCIAASMAGCSGGGSDPKTTNGAGVKLTWLMPGEVKSDTQKVWNRFNELASENIGITVDVQYLDSGAYSERMNMNMASGKDFDLCFTGYINPYSTAARGGGLLGISEYLEEAPKLKESIPDYMWKAATIDGEIYAVPNQQIAASSTAVFILKSMADKYGLDPAAIRKTEDLEPFWQKVKEGEQNVYALRPNWGPESIASLDSEIYYDEITESVQAKVTDGKVEIVSLVEDAEYKRRVELLSDWYQKGYVRPDIASVIDEAQELKAGKFASWFATYKPGVKQETERTVGQEVVVIPLSNPFTTASSITSAMTGIGVKSKHPEEAIKLLEWINTSPEAMNLITYGIEGENYRVVNDNAAERIGNAYDEAAWKYGNQFLVYPTSDQDPDVWEQTMKMNDEAVKSPLLGFSFDMTNVKNEISQCATVTKEFAVAENGSQPPAEYYDSYVKKLKDAGIDRIKAEVQKQVDEFLKNK